MILPFSQIQAFNEQHYGQADKYNFRSNLAEMEDEFYDLSSFAVEDSSMEGMSLLDNVNTVKPNILIGRWK